MSYIMFHTYAERARKANEDLMNHVFDEEKAKIERSVLYHGKEVFINNLETEKIYKHINETKYGYGLAIDYFNVALSFSKIDDNPTGYVVLKIKDEKELLAFKKAYDEGEEINLDEYIYDDYSSWKYISWK